MNKALLLALFLSFFIFANATKADTVITSCPYNVIYPGRYYLDRNVFSTSWFNSYCIRISTSNVLVDLMGFKTGRNMSSYWNPSSGIEILPDIYNVTVINGTLIAHGGALGNNFGVSTGYNCTNITIRNISMESDQYGIRLPGYSGHEVMMTAENIFINSSTWGIYANYLFNSSFTNITLIRSPNAISTSIASYNVFKKSNFGSAIVSFSSTNCTLLCESTFGLVTEYGASYNNTWTTGTCPITWCPAVYPPPTTTTTTTIPYVPACRIMDCSSLKGFPMIIMGLLCGVANFLFCNPLILGFLIVLFIIYGIIKKWKKH